MTRDDGSLLFMAINNDLHIADLQNLDVKLGTPIIHIDMHMVILKDGVLGIQIQPCGSFSYHIIQCIVVQKPNSGRV